MHVDGGGRNNFMNDGRPIAKTNRDYPQNTRQCRGSTLFFKDKVKWGDSATYGENYYEQCYQDGSLVDPTDQHEDQCNDLLLDFSWA